MISSSNILPLGNGRSKEISQLVTGTVAALSHPGYYIVHLGAQVVEAVVAVSCLIVPETADRVLLFQENQSFTILSVLARPGEEGVTLRFPGDARLDAPNGKISLSACQDVNLITANKINMTSNQLSIANNVTQLTSKLIDVTSHHLKGSTQIASIVAQRIETVANTALQHLHRSIRLIQESDIVNAGEMLQTVKRTFSLRSRHALLTAEKDVKVDGERIHMG